MRGKQSKLQRCVQGSYGPLCRLSRNEQRGYSVDAMVQASVQSQASLLDARIELELNKLLKKTIVEVKKYVTLDVCLVENQAQHF
jgi:hypothetical protein